MPAAIKKHQKPGTKLFFLPSFTGLLDFIPNISSWIVWASNVLILRRPSCLSSPNFLTFFVTLKSFYELQKKYKVSQFRWISNLSSVEEAVICIFDLLDYSILFQISCSGLCQQETMSFLIVTPPSPFPTPIFAHFWQLQSFSINFNKNIKQVSCVKVRNLRDLCKQYFAYLI